MPIYAGQPASVRSKIQDHKSAMGLRAFDKALMQNGRVFQDQADPCATILLGNLWPLPRKHAVGPS